MPNKLDIRYPNLEDAEIMQQYFNALSAEKTFIRSQGEQVTLDEEIAFVKNVIDHINNRKAVRLLAFFDNQLAGIGNIDLSKGTERHIGELGISIAKEFRGKGFGEILMKALIEESIKALPDLEIITLGVFSTNSIARSLYKKLGFVDYGVLPKGVKLENGYADYIYMYKKVK